MDHLANTLRNVTATMQRELEEGRRSSHIDANDLIDLLLAIADEIDPPFRPMSRTKSPRRKRRNDL